MIPTMPESTGEGTTTVTSTAVPARLEREHAQCDADRLAAELVATGRRCAADLKPPFSSADHADLYGADALPR